METQKMQAATEKAANQAKPIETAAQEIKNSLSGVMQGLMTGYGLGTAFGSTQVSQADTLFKNNRWYMISNMRQVLSEIYVEHGIVQTLVDIPIDDAFRGGIDIKTDQLDAEQISDFLAYLDEAGIIETFILSKKWERLFGGGGLLIITDEDPEEPLDFDNLEEGGKLAFKAFDLWEIYYGITNIDGNEPDKVIYEPEYYNYYGHKVHKSRIIRFNGKPAPSLIRPKLRGWGISVIESVVRSFNQYLKSVGLSFEVLDEYKVDIYGIQGLNQALTTASGSDSIIKRVQMSNMLKNYQNALIKDTVDTFESKHLTFSGIGEIMKEIRMQIAADLRMPITKLFGISASGFNSGEDDIENYNAMIESEIRAKVKMGLLKILRLCAQNQFGFIPDDLRIEFKPLRILSAPQQEEVKNQQFQRVSGAVQAGLITPLEAKQALNKENLLPIEVKETDELANIPEESKKALDKATPGITLAKPKANSKSWWKRIFSNVKDANGAEHSEKNGQFVGKGGGSGSKDEVEIISKLVETGYVKTKASANKMEAESHLEKLAHRDLENKETGIVAQINSDQRAKIVSNVAIEKSEKNGFTREQHYAVATIIDKLFNVAVKIKSAPDKEGDPNVKIIDRFAAPFKAGDAKGYARLLVKETLQHGNKIYTLELDTLEGVKQVMNALI
jgi:phage-related protein (TIGR01555 family)